MKGAAESLSIKAQMDYLRIPGASEYMERLNLHLSEAIAGELTPQEAMDLCYKDWEKITDRLGRDSQRKYYQQSLEYGKLIY